MCQSDQFDHFFAFPKVNAVYFSPPQTLQSKVSSLQKVLSKEVCYEMTESAHS